MAAGAWLFMSGATVLAALIGLALGILVTLVARMRREHSLHLELASLRERLKNESESAMERERHDELVRQSLQGTFGELASDSLRRNSEMFLQVAAERLGRHQAESVQSLHERETAISNLVQPIREALSKAETQIAAIEKDRVDAFATLRAQMEYLSAGQATLSKETRNLVTALRRPEVRGRWGELTLRRLLELSGMSAHVDFTEQEVVATAAGVLRPDAIVHLHDRRHIAIDVKTPLDAYLCAMEAQDESERDVQMRRHAQVVGARVRELAAKKYWAQFEQSPEFVVMFLPGDQFLSAAMQHGVTLMDEALRQNVIFATPSSLIALLKTVEYGWKQSALAANADEVRKLGEDVYRRLAAFGDHMAKLGKSLTGSVDSFNRAVGSLEQSVLPATRRFPELGLRVDRTLEVIEPVEALARTPRGCADS